MVFVNERKFACEACIKGHRSSSCHHTERPLFEVKKKGRPVSQCSKCRELRQEKRVHSRCTCTTRQPAVDKVPIPAARPDRKPRRFMPSVPTLPNGISDAFQPATSSTPPNSRQRVDSLLNPCHCESVRHCTCRGSSCIAGPSSSGERCPDYGLQALAEAAIMFRDKPVLESAAKHSSDPPHKPCCAVERPSGSHATPPVHLELPPISVGPFLPAIVPDFPTVPSLGTVKSFAGSGCSCSSNCTCPGCIKHRTPRYAEKHHKDCSDGCGHCVDRTAGIELPGQDTSTRGGSLVDIFFARAAMLPSPPLNRRTELDPAHLYEHPASSSAERNVRLPKLDCCRGQCGCPDNVCRCGQSCSGCCDGSNTGGAQM